MTGPDWICPAHVDDPYLKAFIIEQISELGEDAEECGYCPSGALGAPVDDLADLVMEAIHRHYETAANSGMPRDEGAWVFPTMDTTEVLDDLGGFADWDVLQRVSENLEEEDWVRKGEPRMSRYERLSRGWRAFDRHVRHTSRFLLAPIEPPSDYDPDPDLRPDEVLPEVAKVIRNTFDLVDVLSVDTLLYRARSFDDSMPFQHSHELVSPPSSRAAQGRMNAAGISVLYAALDPDTAAAEVYDGKDFVAIACLRPLRELTVVDLTKVPTLSPYDPAVTDRALERAAFLRDFVREITRPITRDNRIHHEYTPTQIVTEYLHWRLLPDEIGVDGVVYPSARTDGKNVVVFAGPEGCLADDDLPSGERPSPARPRREAQFLELVEPRVEVRQYGSPRTTPRGFRDI